VAPGRYQAGRHTTTVRTMNKRPHLARCLALALASTWAICSAQTLADEPTADRHLDVQLALESSRGSYGEPTVTRIQNFSLTTRYRMAGWTWAMEVPWLRIQSATPDASLPDTTGAAATNTVSGLGDIWLKLSHELRPLSADAPGLDVTLKLKTASGDAQRGLGSGGTDLALQLEGTALIAPRTLMFGHIGHRRTGDVPGQKPYRNPWYADAGGQTRLGSAHELGAYFSTRQPIGRLGTLREWTLYGGWRDPSHKVQLYLTHGLTPTSPDWAFGLITRQRF